MSKNTPARTPEAALDYHTTDLRPGGIEARTRVLLEALHRAGPGPYDAAAAASLWGLTREPAGRRLRMLAERGWLSRARHGLYWPVPLDAGDPVGWTDDPWLLAARLYPTGYIGGWSACEHWGLTDQVFRDLLVFAPDRSAPRRVLSGVTPIRAKVVRADKIFGTRTAWRRSTPIRVSDPSRTIVDLLDDPVIGGGIRHVAEVLTSYLTSEHADETLLATYIERLGNRAAFKRLGYLAAALGIGSADLIDNCQSRISRGVSLLDPGADARGPVVTRWNLRINVGVDAFWSRGIGADPEHPPRQTAGSGANMLSMTGIASRQGFLYAGRTLAEWTPVIVARVAERFDPERIVLFGSLASGRAGPDSDIDLLVVFREQANRRSTAVALRLAVADIPAPIDFVVTDLQEIERRGRIVGLALEAALRDGKVVYSRAS